MITLVRSRETVAWPWTKGMVCWPLNPNKSSKATAGQGSSEKCSYCRGHRLLFSWPGLLGEGRGGGDHFYSDNSKPFMFLLCSIDHFCNFFCPRLYELTYFFKFILFLYIYFECACICVCVVHAITCVYGSEDNFWESAFPSIVWIPEIELRLWGLGQGTFTPLNHHAAPNLFLKKKFLPAT